MHFHIALTSEHVAGFGWVSFSELGGYSGREKEDRWIVVKPKTTDKYVGYILVGRLMFYHGLFFFCLSFIFRPLISELAERNSTISMWPNMAQFRWASSEISWRKKKKKESLVKYKSADILCQAVVKGENDHSGILKPRQRTWHQAKTHKRQRG